MKPERMTIEDVRPELRKPLSRIPKMNLDRASSRWLIRALGTLFTMHRKRPDVSISSENFDQASARIYVPKGRLSGAGLVWIHGGGMVLGKASLNDAECSAFANKLGTVVVSVEYRLAPKHSYPAAIDDCYTVWRWFLGNAERLGVDPKRIAIAGQSAGGGLAAALCQRVRDTNGVQPKAQCLYYPMLDDRTAMDEELTEIDHLMWNNRNNSYGWSAYLGQPAGSQEAPPWSAPGRCEDLKGLPPAWIGVGDLDLFLEENRSYADRLKEAGIPIEFLLIEGAPHGFDAVAPDAPVSQDFVASATRFLQKHLEISVNNQ